jgi:hypothetical protein
LGNWTLDISGTSVGLNISVINNVSIRTCVYLWVELLNAS